MKILMILVSLLYVIFCQKNIDDINKLEVIIFELYKADFNECLNFNENYDLIIDKDKIENYLKNKGYISNVKVKNTEIVIEVNLNGYSKYYSFYMVKNNEGY